VQEKEKEQVVYRLDRNYFVSVHAVIPAKGYTWFFIKSADK